MWYERRVESQTINGGGEPAEEEVDGEQFSHYDLLKLSLLAQAPRRQRKRGSGGPQAPDGDKKEHLVENLDEEDDPNSVKDVGYDA